MISNNIFRPLFYLMTAVLVVALMGLASTMSPVMAAKGLNPDEAKTLINDKTVEAVYTRGNASKIFFSSDGTYRENRDDAFKKGVWHIDDKGQLCRRPEDKSTASCHLIVKRGKVWKLYKVPINITKGWKHKSTFMKILDGNPDNL